MQPFEKIKEYGKVVCDQIRWEKAHPIVAEEIENHMIDQRDAYILEGEDELTATHKAISQMGDPETVGVLLDRIISMYGSFYTNISHARGSRSNDIKTDYCCLYRIWLYVLGIFC